MLYAILSIITRHVVEIWIFGATIWLLLQYLRMHLPLGDHLLDRRPGFVLITWSASFTYLEMERFWRAEEMDEKQDSRKEE